MRGIHRSPLNSPHKGQWRGTLIFSLICVWINGWVNTREAGDLRRQRAHYDVSVMYRYQNLRLSTVTGCMIRNDIYNMYMNNTIMTLQRCHNERDGVSNYQRIDCLLNRLFRGRSKKTSKLHAILVFCEGNSPVLGGFPWQRASNTENILTWWRHHDNRMAQNKRVHIISIKLKLPLPCNMLYNKNLYNTILTIKFYSKLKHI